MSATPAKSSSNFAMHTNAIKWQNNGSYHPLADYLCVSV